MGNADSKQDVPKKSSAATASQLDRLSSEVKRIYGIDSSSRMSSRNTFSNIANKAALITKRYLKKSGSDADEKKIVACVSMLARSVIESVTRNLYNKNNLSCIVLASFILVISKLENVDDSAIIQRMGDNCSVEQIREMMADMKKRKFSEKGCYIEE
jgi:hypothetical protein